MSDSPGWSIEDAAAILDPPITADELRALVAAARITPTGTRRTGRRGRPREVYDPSELMRAHAAIVGIWHAA
jgi:hypothetical protein